MTYIVTFIAVDFTHIYDFVEELYSADNGRPSVDPVVLFKMVFRHRFTEDTIEKIFTWILYEDQKSGYL